MHLTTCVFSEYIVFRSFTIVSTAKNVSKPLREFTFVLFLFHTNHIVKTWTRFFLTSLEFLKILFNFFIYKISSFLILSLILYYSFRNLSPFLSLPERHCLIHLSMYKYVSTCLYFLCAVQLLTQSLVAFNSQSW